MTDIERQNQFLKIKHVSQSLLSHSKQVNRSTSKPIASLLQTLYMDLKSLQDPELVMSKPNIDLLLLPLITLYKAMTAQEKQGYDTIIEPWLKVMNFLLSNTLIKLWMSAKFTLELFSLFSNLLSQKSSDEIKYLAVLCLSCTLPAKYKEGRYNSFNQSVYFTLSKSFQTDAFLPMASQGIMALLLMIEQGQDIKLRLESLRVLSQLLFDNIYDADLLSVFFPGIVSKLCKTLSQRPKENHQIMCSSLKVLSELIETVMSDQDNSTLVTIDSFEAALSQAQDLPQSNDPKKKRDKAWYTKSKQSLSNVMSQILKIRLYPDWRTRQAFVEFSFALLSHCARTLDNCIQPLIEMMVLHMDDAYTEVSNTCKLRMQLLSTNPSFEDTIVPILKQELYEWIMKFPKYMISRDETEKTNAISLITGYILLLGDQSSTVLSLVLDRASDGWMTALEIDKDSLSILEQKESQQFIELESQKSTPVYPKIRFKHLATDLTTTKLTRLLNVIGKYSDLKNWIYHFMRYLSSDSNISNDPQAAYIVHSLLSGAFTLNTDGWIDDSEDLDHLKSKLKVITFDVLKDTMDLLIRATVNNSKSNTITTSSSSSFQLDEESGYILTVCFGLQLIGLASTILSQQDLQDQLITMLYPLLAHLGSSNLYIHTYALITLDSIALVCGLDSAKDLAIQNIDYIINMISQHISILSDNPRVPLVLKALIHVGGYASIGYLDDSILEIYDALERYHSNDWLCIQLCSVLFEIIQTMEKNLPEVTETKVPELLEPELLEPEQDVSLEIKSFIQQEEEGVDKEYASMEEIGKYFLQRQAAGKHDEMTLEQSILDQSDLPMDLPTDTDNIEESTPIPLTKEELMVKEIMDRSSHFLTASSPQLRSQMLILLTSGVSILSNHPTELNQLIHSIWIPILNRFKDPQNYVVLQAAHLIERLSSISTDFLSRKFIDDLWPQFKLLLRKAIVAAKNNTLSDYSIYSLYHRTLLCLLKTLTHIVYHVPINQPMVKEILEEIKYYYKNEQVHAQLSNACQQLFDALSTQQPDTVWFYQTCFDTSKLDSPSPLLDPFIIPQWMQVSTKKSTEKVSSEKWDIIIK